MRSLPEAFLANRGAPSRTSGRNKKVNSAARFDSLPTPPNSGGGRNGGLWLNRTEVALAKETEYKLNVLIHQTMRRAKVIDRRFGGRD